MNWRKEKKLSVTALFIAATFYMVFGSTGANNFFPFLSHQEALAQQPAQEQSVTTVEIPLSKGYIDGKIAYFIATDASNEQAVQSITNNTGFPINHAPILAMTPESERGQGYLFLNGARGQLPVANAVPGDKDYSPIWESNFVSWNDNATARELKSVEEILAAQNNGELTITETNTIVNSPAVNMTGGT